jgi:hypothetical protein
MPLFPAKPKHFLIVMISFWMMIFPVDFDFPILDESDFTPSFPGSGKIEQQEDILSVEKGRKILNSTFLINQIFIAQPFLAYVSILVDLPPELNSELLILRC